jgi:hypothetical protein
MRCTNRQGVMCRVESPLRSPASTVEYTFVEGGFHDLTAIGMPEAPRRNLLPMPEFAS